MNTVNVGVGDLVVCDSGAVGRVVWKTTTNIVTEFNGGVCHLYRLDGICLDVGCSHLDINEKYDLDSWMDALDHTFMNRLLDCDVKSISYLVTSGVWVGHQKIPWESDDLEVGFTESTFPIPLSGMPVMHQDVDVDIKAIITTLQNRVRK